MFDYNKILEVERIELESLDKDTLINWEVLDLGKDKDNLRNWICIEVWTDEENKIRILETNDYDVLEITDKLTKKQKKHIYTLVEKELKELNK